MMCCSGLCCISSRQRRLTGGGILSRGNGSAGRFRTSKLCLRQAFRYGPSSGAAPACLSGAPLHGWWTRWSWSTPKLRLDRSGQDDGAAHDVPQHCSAGLPCAGGGHREAVPLLAFSPVQLGASKVMPCAGGGHGGAVPLQAAAQAQPALPGCLPAAAAHPAGQPRLHRGRPHRAGAVPGTLRPCQPVLEPCTPARQAHRQACLSGLGKGPWLWLWQTQLPHEASCSARAQSAGCCACCSEALSPQPCSTDRAAKSGLADCM